MKRALSLNDTAKISNALYRLQQAQTLVYEAAQCLCSVDGFAAEWDAVCRHGSNTKALWHEVNDKLVATLPRRVAS